MANTTETPTIATVAIETGRTIGGAQTVGTTAEVAQAVTVAAAVAVAKAVAVAEAAAVVAAVDLVTRRPPTIIGVEIPQRPFPFLASQCAGFVSIKHDASAFEPFGFRLTRVTLVFC